MKYLWTNIDSIVKKIQSKKLLLFLDYDGTLVPIKKKPDLAVISSQTKAVIKKLAGLKNIKVAVISGRALKDTEKKIGLKNIIYVGSHGFETKCSLLKFKSPVSNNDLLVLKTLCAKLKKKLSSIGGVLFENKPYSFSVHYRLVSKSKIALLNEILRRTLSPYISQNQIKILKGKKVVEIMLPIKWNKGEIVKLFQNSKNFANYFPIYIGDDITDEYAFKAIAVIGITIKVGSKNKTDAQYFVRNVSQVYTFLKFLSIICLIEN